MLAPTQERRSSQRHERHTDSIGLYRTQHWDCASTPDRTTSTHTPLCCTQRATVHYDPTAPSSPAHLCAPHPAPAIVPTSSTCTAAHKGRVTSSKHSGRFSLPAPPSITPWCAQRILHTTWATAAPRRCQQNMQRQQQALQPASNPDLKSCVE